MVRFAYCTFVVLVVASISVRAQDGPPAHAATVNGQPIPNSAVDRALKNVEDPKTRARMRTEAIEYLIETALVDQYLDRMKIAADPKELQERLDSIKQELTKNKQELSKVLGELKMTEAEFNAHVGNDLRWEKFCVQQATDANLKKLFDGNPEMFDGSQVRARHILLTPETDELAAHEKVKEQLLTIRKQVESKAAEAVGKLPPTADAVTREQERKKQAEQAFADFAREVSVCPSKSVGGDLMNWFPRFGSMVEPFAEAAFALQPFQMSQPVKTTFGYHLILVIDRKPGMAVKLDEVKEAVREVYCNKLREAVIAAMRPQAKIVIYPSK